jgi:predicted transcriptional regulator
MGTKRNLTVQLDAEIIRKARVLAVQRSTSVSRLVAEQLEHLVNDEDRYHKAEQVALADLDTGFHLGSGELPSRAELHDR